MFSHSAGTETQACHRQRSLSHSASGGTGSPSGWRSGRSNPAHTHHVGVRNKKINCFIKKTQKTEGRQRESLHPPPSCVGNGKQSVDVVLGNVSRTSMKERESVEGGGHEQEKGLRETTEQNRTWQMRGEENVTPKWKCIKASGTEDGVHTSLGHLILPICLSTRRSRSLSSCSPPAWPSLHEG